MSLRIKLLLLIILFLTGCKKDSPVIPIEETPSAVKGIYIVNEGGFGKSTASLSYFVPDSHKTYSDVFRSLNARTLGDVANDMVIFNKRGYIVVQNSDKVEVISTETHKSVGVLNMPGKTPNKILIVDENKGYITNLYSKSVTVFNPLTLAILKERIPVGENPQMMAYASGKVFVCNSGYGNDSTISVIDVSSDAVVASITVKKGPTDIAVDQDGDVIVVSTGYSDFANSKNDIAGGISVIDPKTLSVTATIEMPLGLYGHPARLALSSAGYGVTVANGIVKFDTKLNKIISQQFINRSPYSIAVDNVEEKIYCGDAKDFVQNGMVYIYSKNAQLVDSLTVGIIPGTIIFNK